MKFLPLITILLLTGCTAGLETAPPLTALFCPHDDCAAHLLSLIKNSESVKCAFFDLNLNEIITALQTHPNAKVILDNNNPTNNFKTDNSKHLMHNKFCIFNSSTVWTGSMNPTINGATKNNNNVLIIPSVLLTESYEQEFNELNNNIFNKGKTTKHPKFTLNNQLVESYFCPEDDCRSHLSTTLRSAVSSIHFMAFSFTDNEIAKLLIQKHRAGIKIEGIMESKRINMRYNKFKLLNKSGINIHQDSNPHTFHHKVFIVDKKIVITGSTNPTKNGFNYNDENMLILHNKDLANLYLKEFNSHLSPANLSSYQN